MALVVLPAADLWWRSPKRSVDRPFLGAAAFTFADVPRGRALSAAQVDGLARRLLAEMTLEQKVMQMSGDTHLLDLLPYLLRRPLGPWRAGVDRRLRLPPLAASDGPRGMTVKVGATCFPVAMARAASWDPDLERRVAEAVGEELRASGVTMWLAPCVNLLRHPRWGRAQETYGEDPYLLGEMAAAAIEGVQRHNVMACVKHFALNSIEETRQQVDVRVDERTLREVYLPHFRRAVEADVAAVMSAYNQVNGDHAAENRHLLRDVLKGDWRFRGFVVSDWFTGVHDGVKAAEAGLDLEMPRVAVYGSRLRAALDRGAVRPERVDEAVLRILRRRIEYAARADPQAYPPEKVHSPEHVALAREAAERGIVLLKNDGLLPLRKESIRTLAVLGPLADRDQLGDHGSSRVRPPGSITPLAGLRAALGPAGVVYEPGLDLERARGAARGADAAVVVAGFNYLDEGEYIPVAQNPREDWGGDRALLGLKPAEVALVRVVAEADPRTAVVLVGGAAITVEEWHERVPAILMAFYQGEQGGTALARVLFGEADPGGRLPFTVPRDASQLPPFDNRAPRVEYGRYHGYTLLERNGEEPRYAFGYGLGYTSFAYANLALDAGAIGEDGEVRVSVDVTNTGQRPGRETVQLYAGFAGSRVERPAKLLRGFRQVALAAGETRRVTLPLRARDLAWYDASAGRWVVERMTYRVLVGPSSRPADLLHAALRVTD